VRAPFRSSTGLTRARIDRPLSRQESDLLRWLLANGLSGASEFLPQIELARAHGKCSCGCPTVGISVPESAKVASHFDSVLADFMGDVGGKDVGVLVFQRDGLLTGLEVYPMGNLEGPLGLPEPESLYPPKWVNQP